MRSIREMIFRQSYGFQKRFLRKRRDLPCFLNARRILGVGVEVGVQRGKFSEQILKEWKGSTLYCVDPWKTWSSDEYQDVANVDNQEQEKRWEETNERLKPFGDRAKILRMTSVDAAKTFADHSLDFVYLDAQHHYEAVKEDLQLWFPKVKHGGLLSGHDYCDEVCDNGVFGVKRAVDEFVVEHRLRLILTHEKPPTWAFFISRTN